MKTQSEITFLLFTAILCSSLVTGCTTRSVYLQDVHLDGPQVDPPLFITKGDSAGDFRIVPRISINDKTPLVGRATGHSNVNTRGVYQVDTVNTGGVVTYVERNGVNTKTFEGRNFRWEPMKFNASINFDYMVTNHFALVGGAQYSSGPSQSYLGANAGIGFSFEGNNVSTRVDLGAHLSTVTYDAHYVVTNTPFSFNSAETEVRFYHETGKDSHVNAYGAFTINTNAPGWPVQVFTQFAINRQTVVQLTQQSIDSKLDNAEALESVSFFIITPGLYFDLSPKSRVLVGVQLRDETALLEAQPGVLVSPFVQFEFGL